MCREATSDPSDRILILAPTGRDAVLARDALASAGLRAEACMDIAALCREIVVGAGAALVASEALTRNASAHLTETLARQPAWSDLPLIILTRGGGSLSGPDDFPDALDKLGNTTLLERPLRVATLVHAVQAALGARRRQYEVRGHLEEHVRMEQRLQAEHAKQRVFLRDVLLSVTGGRLRLCDSSADLPDSLPLAFDAIPLTQAGGLSGLRGAAKRAALDRGLADDRWQDLLTAVSEAAMNAIVHGGGGVGRVCADEVSGTGTVQVWVEDRGRGIDVEALPRAALSKGYTTVGSLGHGMKMMLETTDRVWLLTGSAGTTVVMEQDRQPPKPHWY